ncbi:Rha family transcriptional regulator [Dysgonomonas termitidis]
MNKNLVLKNEEGKLITTSKIVAGIFGKRHDNVLKDIREMECSKEFRLLNFKETFEMRKLPLGGAVKSPYFEMTKDGFGFLAMGYRGAKAARFKEDFIRAFNRMEDMLNSDEYIQYRFVQIVEKKIKQLEAELLDNQKLIGCQQERIAGLSPKAEYTENVLNSPDTYTSTQMAKELGLRHAKQLHLELKARGILFKQSDQWMLCSGYTGKGYTGTRTFMYPDKKTEIPRTSTFTVWTEKGRQFLHGIFQ